MPAIYILHTAVNLLCSILLLRAYSRVRKRLLFWSGLYFAGTTLVNALVFVDLVVFPEVDLYPFRLGISLIAAGMLVFGLIWGER
jgi:hypothetical protein